MKILKYVFFVVVAMAIVGGITNYFTSDADKAQYRIEDIHENISQVESVTAFKARINEVDSLVDKFPELKPTADSLIYQKQDKWLAEVKEKQADSHLYRAYKLSTELVKKRLKAPSKAKFPDYVKDDPDVWREGDTYISQFWCDAQNSYGADLRSDWQVELRREDGKFKVVDVMKY